MRADAGIVTVQEYGPWLIGGGEAASRCFPPRPDPNASPVSTVFVLLLRSRWLHFTRSTFLTGSAQVGCGHHGAVVLS